MSTRKTTVFYGVLIAIASIAVGMVIASQWGLPQASSAQTINVPAANTAALNGPIDAQTFRNIAKAQSPTVVNIRTTARARGRELTEFFGGQDDLLQRFFGQGQGAGPGTPPAGTRPRGAAAGRLRNRLHHRQDPASSSPTTTSSKAPTTSASACSAAAGRRATRRR